MDTIPPIRAAKTREFYRVYLNSPDWKARRRLKLQEVNWRCEKCASKRDLEVHHRSYENFGHETSGDLQALCANCHRDDHLADPDQTSLGVYLKLASAAVRESPYASIADLSETVKRRCIELKIPAIPERVHSALSVVCGNRLKTSPAQSAVDVKRSMSRPLTPDEVRDFWCRMEISGMDFSGLIKSMPMVRKTPDEQRQHEAKLAVDASVMLRFRQRRPVMDQLKEIFGDEAER